MNDQEVNKQIQQMVRFIKQEAQEKANEINIAADEEFNVEKQQIVEDEKKKIKNEVEKKEQSLLAKQKIEYSTELNKMRLGVLNRRNEGLESILTEAKKKLSKLSKDKAKYTELVKQLILQGAKCLHLSDVVVRCRPEDTESVKEAVQKAMDESSGKLGEQVKAKIDDKTNLKAGPSGDDVDEAGACLGGVVILSPDGRVRCTQTLEERLRLAYSANMPSIRRQVFSEDV